MTALDPVSPNATWARVRPSASAAIAGGVVGGFGAFSLDALIRVGDPMTPHLAASLKSIPAGVIGVALGVVGAGVVLPQLVGASNRHALDTAATGVGIGLGVGAVLGALMGRGKALQLAAKYVGTDRTVMLLQEFTGSALTFGLIGGAAGGFLALGRANVRPT